MKRISFVLLVLALISTLGLAQDKNNFTVIGYFSGRTGQVDQLAAEKLTHIIFSFCHLKGNQLAVDNAGDSVTIHRLVALKMRNPNLKIILSLGGWGGCETCSPVFSTAEARKEFAQSVLKLNQQYKTDGIDLDWEYPAIEGYPGHAYKPEDKQNFTALVQELRNTLGRKYEISFAAGGFQKFLDESVEWKKIMPLLDRVNLMTYDLINGYSTETGHHTALYSRAEQKESTDNAVQYLIKLGVPRDKLVIGAAFYGRSWENVEGADNGLYKGGKFKSFVDYKRLITENTADKGYHYFWDEQVKAPYLYNPEQKIFVTYDDKKSIALKTQYVIDQKLDGIMFWELTCDSAGDGLLDEIDRVKRGK